MEPKLQSINIHALIQSSGGPPSVRLSAGLQRLVQPLLEPCFLIVQTTNKSPSEIEPSFVFLLKISADFLELEEKKEGRTRFFKLIFGSSFLSVNQRRAMGEDFKLFSERLKILGLHLQKKSYQFWGKILNAELQLVDDSATLSQKTAGSLLQLAQKISSSAPSEMPPATVSGSPQLDEIKGMLLDILESANCVVITNSELIKKGEKAVYTFTITSKYANFVERSSVMQNKWEMDFLTMKALLNQSEFLENSADWLSNKIESMAQDLVSNRAEMYRK